MVLSNVIGSRANMSTKPVLNLKLVVLVENFWDKEYEVFHVDSVSACENNDYLIYEDSQGKRLPLIIKPSNKAVISKFEENLSNLNLNNLLSLEIGFEGRNCFKYPYHLVLLNGQYKTGCLKKLKLDVNFMCGYCTEFVANVQDTFPKMKELDITTVIDDHSSVDVMICLSLSVFENFQRDSWLRKTLVHNIPIHCVEFLDTCIELDQLKVLPE